VFEHRTVRQFRHLSESAFEKDPEPDLAAILRMCSSIAPTIAEAFRGGIRIRSRMAAALPLHQRLQDFPWKLNQSGPSR